MLWKNGLRSDIILTMLKIRLTRVGTKNKPKYRIVVTPKENKRDGQYLEMIGQYDPTLKPAKLVVKKERFNYWVSVGAQASQTVKKLME